jgi:hypothetical protein
MAGLFPLVRVPNIVGSGFGQVTDILAAVPHATLDNNRRYRNDDLADPRCERYGRLGVFSSGGTNLRVCPPRCCSQRNIF